MPAVGLKIGNGSRKMQVELMLDVVFGIEMMDLLVSFIVMGGALHLGVIHGFVFKPVMRVWTVSLRFAKLPEKGLVFRVSRKDGHAACDKMPGSQSLRHQATP